MIYESFMINKFHVFYVRAGFLPKAGRYQALTGAYRLEKGHDEQHRHTRIFVFLSLDETWRMNLGVVATSWLSGGSFDLQPFIIRPTSKSIADPFFKGHSTLQALKIFSTCSEAF